MASASSISNFVLVLSFIIMIIYGVEWAKSKSDIKSNEAGFFISASVVFILILGYKIISRIFKAKKDKPIQYGSFNTY